MTLQEVTIDEAVAHFTKQLTDHFGQAFADSADGQIFVTAFRQSLEAQTDFMAAISAAGMPDSNVVRERLRTMGFKIDLLPEPLPDGEYAIVECMGHSTLVGRVMEIDRFGTKMLQIECVLNGKLLASILQAGASIYRFTSCTKEVAAAWGVKEAWQLPAAIRATLPVEALPAPQRPPYEQEDDEYEDDEYEDDGEGTFPE